MKFMLGVLHGKWIVRTSWVSDCLRAQSPASEKSHEVVSDTRGKSSGPILGRMHAGLKLLRNWEVRLLSFVSSRMGHLPISAKTRSV